MVQIILRLLVWFKKPSILYNSELEVKKKNNPTFLNYTVFYKKITPSKISSLMAKQLDEKWKIQGLILLLQTNNLNYLLGS